jgi:hypothetical protein
MRKLLTALMVAAALTRAGAVMFYSTGDPTFNTNAPGGALAGSGWQWVGNWGSFTGVPIASNLFLTAKHVGGSVGNALGLNGSVYITTAKFDDANSDLTVWQVAGTFPSWAPMYTGTNEVGGHVVVIGRGTQRGAEFLSTNGVLKGWYWGGYDGVQRWGENDVTSIEDGGVLYNDLLYSTFDAGAGVNEAHLSVGDSSGAMFLYQDGIWQLAGINFAVDGPFSATNGGYQSAALFDAGDVWLQSSPTNILFPELGTDIPSGFYATRISSRMDFITSVIPEPATGFALLLGTAASSARRRRRR